MMLLEKFPYCPIHAKYFKLDWRASLKFPPLKAVRARIVHPVWLKPVDDVVVTGNGNKLRA